MTKNKGGRPTKMTNDTVNKLEEAFSWGCTDVEACLYAGISKPTLYDYIKENPSFSDRKESLKQNPTLKARRILNLALDDDKDVKTAQYQLDKADGKAKQAVDMNVGGDLTVTRIKKNFDGE